MDTFLSDHHDENFSHTFYMRNLDLVGNELGIVRKLIPLPGNTVIATRFRHLHVSPGLIQPVLQYLTIKCQEWEDWQKLGVICFDELNLRVFVSLLLDLSGSF